MAANRNSNGEIDSAKSGVAVKQTPFQQMLRAMSFDAEAEDVTFNGDDLNAILSAETEEELFESDNRPPLNFQHLAGCELSILDVSVKYSRAGSNDDIQTPFTIADDKGRERKMYLMVSAVRLSDTGSMKSVIRLPEVGEVFQANTSARFVVAKLWRANTMGLINSDTGRSWDVLVDSTDLGGGQAVIKLAAIPKRVTRSTAAE